MGWLFGLFSLAGRTSRIDYWRFQQGATVAAAIIVVATILVAQVEGPVYLPLLLIIPLLLAGVATSVRRMHDRGHSTALALILTLGPFVMAALVSVLADQSAPSLRMAAWPTALAGLGMAIWATVEISFLRGMRGPNRFGPEPPARSRPLVVQPPGRSA